MSTHDAAERVVEAVRPRLRGCLHLGAFPVSAVCGVVLVLLAEGGRARAAAAVYALSAVMLFGVSAVYHRGDWSGRSLGVLKRLDHSSIFLIIAGTYTPFAVLLLEDSGGQTLLWVVWAGALGGVAFRVLWVGAPRWLYTPVYLALGWVALFYLPALLEAGGPALMVLVAVGGGLYTAGGIVYALRRPNPSPRWFGFHEVFHGCTLVGYVTHYVAVSMATYGYAV
jgi:hemolysin III